jgi:hypothetical protein
MEEDRAAHIKELTEARNAVERQIEILVSGSPPEATNRQLQIGDLIKQLRNTLSELEACIGAESESDST